MKLRSFAALFAICMLALAGCATAKHGDDCKIPTLTTRKDCDPTPPPPTPCPAPFLGMSSPCPDASHVSLSLAGCLNAEYYAAANAAAMRALTPVNYVPADFLGMPSPATGLFDFITYTCSNGTLSSGQAFANFHIVFAGPAVKSGPDANISSEPIAVYATEVYTDNTQLGAYFTALGFPTQNATFKESGPFQTGPAYNQFTLTITTAAASVALTNGPGADFSTSFEQAEGFYHSNATATIGLVSKVSITDSVNFPAPSSVRAQGESLSSASTGPAPFTGTANTQHAAATFVPHKFA